jgi:hypothetical protein
MSKALIALFGDDVHRYIHSIRLISGEIGGEIPTSEVSTCEACGAEHVEVRPVDSDLSPADSAERVLLYVCDGCVH